MKFAEEHIGQEIVPAYKDGEALSLDLSAFGRSTSWSEYCCQKRRAETSSVSTIQIRSPLLPLSGTASCESWATRRLANDEHTT